MWREYQRESMTVLPPSHQAYTMDGDGAYLQASVSCCEDECHSLPGAIRACDRYFGYRSV